MGADVNRQQSGSDRTNAEGFSEVSSGGAGEGLKGAGGPESALPKSSEAGWASVNVTGCVCVRTNLFWLHTRRHLKGLMPGLACHTESGTARV